MKKRFGRWFWLAFGGFSIAFVLGSSLVLPLFDNKTGIEWLTGGSRDEPVRTDSESNPDGEPYDYWYAPENSFGISSTKTINDSYFKELFLAHTDWMLEYKRYEWSSWTDGSDYLTIERTWNDSGFWKFNLILDVPVDIYSARFTFGIDLPCLQYVERSGTEVWINYTANETETYSCMFNWSDIAGIPGIVISKGRTDDMFWFRFRRDDIPSGHYEFDPTFGFNALGGVSPYVVFNGGEKRLASFDKPSSDGTADNISFYFVSENFGVGDYVNVSCALYAYVDVDDAGALIDITEFYIINDGDSAGWVTLDFDAPKPSLVAETNYFICLGVNSHTLVNPEDCHIGFTDDTPFGESIDEYESGFENPWTGEGTDFYTYAFYCSYTETSDWTIFDTGINGSIYNASVDIWQVVNSSISGNIYNSSIWSAFNNSISGSIYNSSEYIWTVVNNSISGSIYNSTGFQVVNSSISGSIFNLSSWDEFNITISGSIYNLSDWDAFNTSLSGSIYNSTIWYAFNTSINGSIYNASVDVWQAFNTSISGSIFNASAIWSAFNNSISGSIYNATASWQVFNNSISGSIFNLSIWSDFNITVSGVIFNLSSWVDFNTSISGSIYNSTIWNVFNNTINGTIRNTTISWQAFSTSISGSIYNLSGFVSINNTFNGTIYNISVDIITISNEYPSNSSSIFDLQPTLYFTLANTLGMPMNYSIYIGNSTINTSTLLTTVAGVDNGTFFYSNYYPATEYFDRYYWRVTANVSSYSLNETFLFDTASSGGGGGYVGSPSSVYIIGAMGLLGIIGILGFLKKRKKEDEL